MKLILTLILLLICSTPILSQQDLTSRAAQPEGIDYFLRLGIEYIIKNNPTPDPNLIKYIPFEQYNKQRHATLDLEFTDLLTNYTIILYSEQKCLLNKQ